MVTGQNFQIVARKKSYFYKHDHIKANMGIRGQYKNSTKNAVKGLKLHYKNKTFLHPQLKKSLQIICTTITVGKTTN